MFRAIGRFSIRHRFWVILFWVVVAGVLTATAPSLSKVGVSSDTNFLPDNAASLQAQQLLQEKFPSEGASDEALLVFIRNGGLTQADLQYAQSVAEWLTSSAAPAQVIGIQSPFENPELKSQLSSSDGAALMILIFLSTPSDTPVTDQAVAAIEAHVASHPSGLEVYLTGQAPLARDTSATVQNSINRTTLAAILLVIIVLLLIYRSPVAALVPLITIAAAYLAATGLIGFMAQAGVALSTQTDAYAVVIIFGVGTDYCLFIVSRFREELAGQKETLSAGTRAMERIGAVISASGTVVILAFLILNVAQFESTRTLGLALALSVFITLLAGLTLTPALIGLMGRHLFWPFASRPGGGESRAWHAIATVVDRHAAIAVPVVVVLLLVPYIFLPHLNRNFDVLGELPSNVQSVQGYRALEQHFDLGELSPTQVVLVAKQGAITQDVNAIAQADAAARSQPGVGVVRSLLTPTGDPNEAASFLVSSQLSQLVAQITQLVQSLASGSVPSGGMQAAAQGLNVLAGYLKDLAGGYPTVATTPAYQQAVKLLADIETLLQSGVGASQLPTLTQDLTQLVTSLNALQSQFAGKQDYLYSPALLQSVPGADQLAAFFLSSDGTATRLFVVLKESPYSNAALQDARDLRSTLDSLFANSAITPAVAGETIGLADVGTLMNVDFSRILPLTVAAVFIVMALLLRSLVAPLFLVVTVVLSFGTALGLATWVYQDLLGYSGLNILLPTMVFVVLVALGSDYNIFLMSRVREETRGPDFVDGLITASTRTGAIITSAGLVLAGTFAAMLFAPLKILVQIGGTVAMGILVDTFIVRAMLVPAVASLIKRANWWPGK